MRSLNDMSLHEETRTSDMKCKNALTINFILMTALLMIHIHWMLFCDAQIENKYGPLGKEFGAAGMSYTSWVTKMVVGLGTGVPRVMYKQDNAPDPLEKVFSLCQQLHFNNVMSG
jgi:hypothetical protein